MGEVVGREVPQDRPGGCSVRRPGAMQFPGRFAIAEGKEVTCGPGESSICQVIRLRWDGVGW